MATIAIAPITLKDVDLKIGADNYELHVSRVRFVPATSQVTWKGLSPSAVYTDNTTPVWTLELAGAQDAATTASLSQYLNDPANVGTKKVCIFKPKKGSTLPTYTATILISPVAIGGDVDTVPTWEVTLGVEGTPVRSVA